MAQAHINTDDCWLYARCIRNGYARLAISFEGKTFNYTVHRLMHDADWTPLYRAKEPWAGEVPEPDQVISKTVEIMVSGNDAFERWFDKKYDGNPGGYIPVKEIPVILKRADSKLYKVIDLLAPGSKPPQQLSDAPSGRDKETV